MNLEARIEKLTKLSMELDPIETERILDDYPEPRSDDDDIYLEHDLITEIDCHEHAPLFFGHHFKTDELGRWKSPNYADSDSQSLSTTG
jgi:hypothetical protein